MYELATDKADEVNLIQSYYEGYSVRKMMKDVKNSYQQIFE